MVNCDTAALSHLPMYTYPPSTEVLIHSFSNLREGLSLIWMHGALVSILCMTLYLD